MKRFRKMLGRAFETLLAISGSVTSLVMLLMIIFLFKEGFALFRCPTVESGFSLYVNAENPLRWLSAAQIGAIFDGTITSWSHVGGHEGVVRPFRFEEIFDLYAPESFGNDDELLPTRLAAIVSGDKNIIALLPDDYVPKHHPDIVALRSENLSPADFLTGREWMPTATPAPRFGILPLLSGTIWVSLFAILIALPPGLGVAVYLSELAGERLRRTLKPTIELLAGIPSVVYGFFGLVVIVPLLQTALRLPVGETALAGSLILAIMALPTIITVTEDALRNTPKSLKEASLALGATHWQTIRRVIIPCATSGISAAVVLGIGRAVGETMAVLMVTGNAALMPRSLLEPVRTVPATIAAELGEAPAGGTHYRALFMLGSVLFVLTLLISLSAEMMAGRQRKKGR
jgi:phosphate transport system permease protein